MKNPPAPFFFFFCQKQQLRKPPDPANSAILGKPGTRNQIYQSCSRQTKYKKVHPENHPRKKNGQNTIKDKDIIENATQ